MNYNQKIYLTLVIALLIIIGLFFFLVIPLKEKIKTLSADFIQKSSLIESYKEKSGDYLAKLKDDYIEIESETFKINGSFVDPEKAIDFILAVEQAASLTSNYQEIKEIVPPEKAKDSLYFQISSWGAFPNLVKFLVQLENMGYFVEFKSLQIARMGERGTANLINEDILVSVGDVKGIIDIEVYTIK